MVRLKASGYVLVYLGAALLLSGCPDVGLKQHIVELAAPKKPTNLTATALVQSQVSSVRLDWINNDTNVTRILVERSNVSVSAGFTLIDELPKTAVTYLDQLGLNEETQYWYRVGAENDVGPSYSAVATATTWPLMSDADAVSADFNTLSVGFATGDSASSVTQNLSLPIIGANGSNIGWESSNAAINVSNTATTGTGTVTGQAVDTPVTLTATISRGTSSSLQKVFNLTVKQSDAGAVAADKSALVIVYGSDDSASSVTQDLTLPASGSNGSTISWASDTPGIVSTTGVVVRPDTVGDSTVIMTATITKGSAVEQKSFTLTVKLSDLGAVNIAATVLASALPLSFGTGDSASSVTQNFTFPTAGSNDTTIEWTSDNTAIINTTTTEGTGIILRPDSADTVVRLTATIRKNSTTAASHPYWDLTVIKTAVTDADKVAADKSSLVINYASGDSVDAVTQNLGLQTVGANGTVITWASSNTAVVANNGVVTRQMTDVANITLTATITKGSEFDTKVFSGISVLQSDAGAVAEAKADLAIVYNVPDVGPSSVTTGLSLVLTGAKGTSIVWSSDKPLVIANNGTVTRPASTTEVTLTATITKGSEFDTKVFSGITVLQSDAGAVAEAKAALAIGYNVPDVGPSSVTTDLTLALTGVNGTTIVWSSDKPSIVAINGTVTRPASTTEVTLTATISKGTEVDTKAFTVTVLGNSIKLRYLDGGAWADYPDPPASTISVSEHGPALYALTSSGELYSCDGGWHKLPPAALTGARSISAYTGTLWALTSDLMLHYLDGINWKPASLNAPSGSVSLAGTGNTLYVLAGSTIHQLDGGSWTSIGAPSSPVSIAVRDGVLYALTGAGDIHYSDGSWTSKLPNQAPADSSVIGGGSSNLYVLSYQ